jgi:hypothetical protein
MWHLQTISSVRRSLMFGAPQMGSKVAREFPHGYGRGIPSAYQLP